MYSGLALQPELQSLHNFTEQPNQHSEGLKKDICKEILKASEFLEQKNIGN
jgi:hypothetical protein